MKYIAWFVIIGSMIIMQSHSIPFWEKVTSSTWNGWLSSIMVESVALLFWYQGYKILAPLATSVVVGTIIFQISAPNIDLIMAISENKKIDNQMQTVVSVLDNIKGKAYPITIQKTLKTLEALSEKSNKKEVKSTTEIQVLIIIVEGIMIFLLLFAQIKMVVLLAKKESVTSVTDTSVTTTRYEHTTTSINDLASEVLRECYEFGEVNKLHSERAIRLKLDLNPPDFERLKKVIKDGVGMSENKMLEIREKIKNYKD